MSDCVLSHKIVTARKQRPCHWCGQPIFRGDKCDVQTGRFDGSLYRSSMHPECQATLASECGVGGMVDYTPYEMERGEQ